jgi:hypothetical protein
MNDETKKRPMQLHPHPVVHPDHEFRAPSGRIPPTEQKEPEPLGRATVARGRTLHMPVAGEFRQTGWSADEKRAVCAQVWEPKGPGSEVELPVSEIRRLRRLGFLIDSDRAPVPIASGNGAAA